MRGIKSTEELVLVSFKIKKTTHQALRSLYPRTGYSHVLRQLAESHVAARLSKEVNLVITDSDGSGNLG